MITASHLPAGFNGMKFLREEKQIMGYEAGLKEVEALIESGELDKILLAEKKVYLKMLTIQMSMSSL